MGPTLPPNVLQPLWNAVASLVGEVPPGSDPEFALVRKRGRGMRQHVYMRWETWRLWEILGDFRVTS